MQNWFFENDSIQFEEILPDIRHALKCQKKGETTIPFEMDEYTIFKINVT